MAPQTKVLLDGLVFPECPRWHDGKLWFSDMHARKVMTVGLDGKTETIVEVAGQPAGLGWLPDGQLLIVSQVDFRLLKLGPSGLTEVAGLGGIARTSCNDMVVDARGRAYIGHFGTRADKGPPPFAEAEIITVTPDGVVGVAADSLLFPNGMVITPGGHTLIVAESFGERLSAFDIEADGSLTRRRVWAALPGLVPDGICCDAAGGVWVANAGANQVVHVQEGGRIDRRVDVADKAFACMLGGPDRRTLFVMTASTVNADEARAKRSGRIETTRVEVPGAGLP
jgi:sugar lactone lactonase YvrE